MYSKSNICSNGKGRQEIVIVYISNEIKKWTVFKNKISYSQPLSPFWQLFFNKEFILKTVIRLHDCRGN